jgi:hypothetical protein
VYYEHIALNAAPFDPMDDQAIENMVVFVLARFLECFRRSNPVAQKGKQT